MEDDDIQCPGLLGDLSLIPKDIDGNEVILNDDSNITARTEMGYTSGSSQLDDEDLSLLPKKFEDIFQDFNKASSKIEDFVKDLLKNQAAADTRVSQLKIENEQLVGSNGDLTRRLKEMKVQIDDQSLKSHNTISDLNDKVAHLETNNAEMQLEIIKLKDDLAARNRDVKDLEQQSTLNTNELMGLKKDKEDLMAQVAEKDEFVDEVLKKNIHLEGECQILRQYNYDANGFKEISKETNDKVNKLNEENNRLLEEIKNAKNDIATKKEKLRYSKTWQDNAQKKCKENMGNITDLDKKLDALEELQEVNKELTEKLARYRKKTNDLQNHLTQKCGTPDIIWLLETQKVPSWWKKHVPQKWHNYIND